MGNKTINALWQSSVLLLGLITTPLAAGPRSELPYTFRAIRENWNQGSSLAQWILAIFVLVLGGLFAWGLMNQLRLWPKRRRAVHNPQQLFRELLETLDLTEQEKKLLRNMTRGARLKHPAMSVLSPALLNWTKHLWLEEKGPRRVDSETLSQIDTLGWKLFSGPASTRPSAEPVNAPVTETIESQARLQTAVMVELQENRCGNNAVK